MKQTICILLSLLAFTAIAQDPVGAKRFTDQIVHESRVNSVAISPDGTKAITSSNNLIRVWDAHTGKEIQRTYFEYKNPNPYVIYDPDRTKALIISNTIKILNVYTGQEVKISDLYSDYAFNYDKSQIIIVNGNTIKIYDINKELEINTISGFNGKLSSIKFSHDGTKIIGSINNIIKIWDTKTGVEIRTLSEHINPISYASFSEDDTKIISISNNIIKTWDSNTGNENSTLSLSLKHLRKFAFSRDASKIIFNDENGTVRLWNVIIGKEIKKISTDNRLIEYFAFSPDDSKIIIVPFGREVIVCNAKTGKTIKVITNLDTFNFAFSFDNSKIAYRNYNSTSINLLNFNTGKQIKTFPINDPVPYLLYSLAFNPDGTKITYNSSSNTTKFLEINNKNTTQTFQRHNGRITSVAFSREDEKIITGSEDNTIKIWNRESWGDVQTLLGHTDEILSVAFSTDGKKVISSSRDKKIKIWDTKTGKEIQTLSEYTDWVTSVAFSPDGTKAVSYNNDNFVNSVKIWNINTGKEIRSLYWHERKARSVTFSPDGTKIISGGSDSTIKIWEISTGKEIQTLSGHTGSVVSIAITPDGTKIVSGSNDNTIKIWDLNSGREIQTLFGHSSWVKSVAISQDKKRIISGGDDNTVKIWDIDTGKEIKSWNINLSPIQVSFAKDDKSVNIATAAYWVNFPIEESIPTSTKIYITSPNARIYKSEPLKTNQEKINLEAIINTSLNEEDLKDATKVYINGHLYTGKLGPVKLSKASQQDYDFEQSIKLEEGLNTIEIVVTEANQAISRSPLLQVFYTPSPKANLYLLTFGVQYPDLHYTDKDAQTIHRLFKSQAGTLFNEVFADEPYIGNATDASKIAQKLESLQYRFEIREQDVLILFISGHGEILDGDFRVLGKDYDDSAPRRSSVSFSEDIIANLSKVKGKRIILIDACLSGASVGKGLSNANQLIANTPPGMITITSSAGHEKSYEHKAWNNGAFVKGIREGLEDGKADKDKDRYVTLQELFDYLGMRVPQIVKSVDELKHLTQTPQIKKDGIDDFPIFLIK